MMICKAQYGGTNCYTYNSANMVSILFTLSQTKRLSKQEWLHCALSCAVYCNRSCLFVGAWVCVCVWECYHNNSKLRASILTKLGLWVTVVTISNWLNFGHPAPREGVCGGAKIFSSALPAHSVCVSPSAFFLFFCFQACVSIAVNCTRPFCSGRL